MIFGRSRKLILLIMIFLSISVAFLGFSNQKFKADTISLDPVALRKDIALGVLSHASEEFYPVYSQINFDTQLQLVKEMNAGWVRTALSRGKFLSDNNYFTKYLDKADTAGINLFVIAPPSADAWTTNQDIYNNNFNLSQKIGQKYGNRITNIELSNEVELGSIISGTNGDLTTHYDTAKYEQVRYVLAGMRDGFKSANPNIKLYISLGGWLHYGFLDRLVADGFNFDGISWHWYSNMGDMANTWVSTKNTNINVAAKLASYGKEIWVTENNTRYGTRPGVVTETTQAYYLANTISLLANLPQVKGYFIYELLDLGDMDLSHYTGNPDDGSSNPAEAYYGLVKVKLDSTNHWIVDAKKYAFNFVRNAFHSVSSANNLNYEVQFKNDTSSPQFWVWDKRPEIGIGAHGAGDLPSLTKIKALGMNVVRTSFYWSLAEEDDCDRNPYNNDDDVFGVYCTSYLQQFDGIVANAKSKNIKLLFLLSGNPTGVGFANRDASYQYFAKFAGDMAARYKDVIYWELWNEMDAAFTNLFGYNVCTAANAMTIPECKPTVRIGSSCTVGQTYNATLDKCIGVPMIDRGKFYAEMLKLAYPAIKKANPDSLVLTGGMTDTNLFPTGIYEGGGKDYFDIMAIHTYGLPLHWASVSRGQNLKYIMDANGDEGKPLWITELGVTAGTIQTGWGYPRTWNTPTDKNLDSPECSWDSYTKDATTNKLIYDGDGFDYQQCEQWRTVIDYNSKLRDYNKILFYQFYAVAEQKCSDGTSADLCPGAVLDTTNPDKDSIEDYSFGIVRSDFTKLVQKPVYNWFLNSKPNQAIATQPQYTTDIRVNAASGYVPTGYDYYYSGGDLIIKNVSVNNLTPTKIEVKNLIVNKKASMDLVASGNTITYSITLSNPLSSPITKIFITDILPDRLQYISGSASNSGTYDTLARKITWNLPTTLSPGQNLVLTYRATAY